MAVNSSVLLVTLIIDENELKQASFFIVYGMISISALR